MYFVGTSYIEEPQSVAKRKMEGYVNSGENVSNEFEMKKERLEISEILAGNEHNYIFQISSLRLWTVLAD